MKYRTLVQLDPPGVDAAAAAPRRTNPRSYQTARRDAADSSHGHRTRVPESAGMRRHVAHAHTRTDRELRTFVSRPSSHAPNGVTDAGQRRIGGAPNDRSGASAGNGTLFGCQHAL